MVVVPGTILSDLLDGAYKYILDNRGNPIPHWMSAPGVPIPGVNTDNGAGYFTTAGFGFSSGIRDVHKVFVGAQDMSNSQLTWENTGDVVQALTTWMRLYGWRRMTFLAFENGVKIGSGSIG